MKIRSEKLNQKLHLFRNLTRLELFEKNGLPTYIEINYSFYISSYLKKYNQYPPLLSLKTDDNFDMRNLSILTNLRNLNYGLRCICPKVLNKIFGLTSLTFTMWFENTLNDFNLFHDLKILEIQNHHHIDRYTNYNGLINLEKLTIRFSTQDSERLINIKYPKLTYLLIKTTHDARLKTFSINLDSTMKLKYLKLRNVYFNRDYLKIASYLKTLDIIYPEFRNIELSEECNGQLKYLKLRNVICPMSDRLTKLIIYDVK